MGHHVHIQGSGSSCAALSIWESKFGSSENAKTATAGHLGCFVFQHTTGQPLWAPSMPHRLPMSCPCHPACLLASAYWPPQIRFCSPSSILNFGLESCWLWREVVCLPGSQDSAPPPPFFFTSIKILIFYVVIVRLRL